MSADEPNNRLAVPKNVSAMPSSHEEPESGLVQIRVIGFGAEGTAAVANLEKHPAPGLSFMQYKPPKQAGGKQKSGGIAASSLGDFDSWLECAQTLVLIVDENDVDLHRDAIALGRHAMAQGLLTIGVRLDGNVGEDQGEDHSQCGFFEELDASMHSCIRLAFLGNQIAHNRTALVLHSLTTGLAKLCNVQGSISVDYEDVLSVLGEPARLSVGVGAASGSERGLIAAQAALANLRPAVLSPESVQTALIMLSAVPGQLRLSETKLAMNTVSAALGEGTHCIYGVYFDELPVDQTGVNTLDTLRLSIFLTSPA